MAPSHAAVAKASEPPPAQADAAWSALAAAGIKGGLVRGYCGALAASTPRSTPRTATRRCVCARRSIVVGCKHRKSKSRKHHPQLTHDTGPSGMSCHRVRRATRHTGCLLGGGMAVCVIAAWQTPTLLPMHSEPDTFTRERQKVLQIG